MKARIKNYQIIKDADLEFLPGITAIVGSSNNGKSSIIRAIEAAINNKGGNSFINYDADSCEVEIEDNGHVIKWQKHKKQGKSFYEIDGKILNKIGQKQLDEVGILLNMPEIEVNTDRFRLNFWKQMNFPFLVGKTSYQLFDFISKSNEQELISELQDKSAESFKQLAKDVDYKNALIDSKQTDISSLNKEIAELKKFDSFDIEKFDSLYEINSILDNTILELSTVNAEIEANTTKLNKVNSKVDSLQDITKKIYNLLLLYKTIDSHLVELKNINIELAKLREDYSISISGESKMSHKLTTIRDIITDLNTVDSTYNEYIKLFNSVKETVDKKDELTKEINKVNAEIININKEISKFTICPLCGGSLGDHTHE